MTNLQIYKIKRTTTVEGPGKRFCIWVQGCSRHCKGCMSEQTWSKEEGIEYTADEIFTMIKSTPDIEGITFLGGEPFEQAEGLSILAEKIQSIGLSIVAFTGYKIEELKNLDNLYINKLLDQTDLLIDSPFEIDKFNLDRPWVGSSNQRYIFLTDRYDDKILETKNKVEIAVLPNGKIQVDGMGDFNKVKEII